MSEEASPTPHAPRGVIYVATGDSYRRDAERSAASLKAVHPDLPVCLFSDKPSDSRAFDSFVAIDDPHARSKLDCLAKTPFAKTLYLDCDTRVVGSIMEPFDLLDPYDMAICHVKQRNEAKAARKGYSFESAPGGFYAFNSGVMYYRSAPQVLRFVENWSTEYRRRKPRLDQILLRELLWKAPEIRIYVLPVEYNLRDLGTLMLTSPVLQQARVLHLPWYNSRSGWFKRLRLTLKRFPTPLQVIRNIAMVFR